LGAFLGEIDIKYPFMAAALFAFLNAAYGYFVLPESLPKEHRRRFEWSHANPLIIFKTLVKYSEFGILLFAFTLVYIGQKAVEYLLSFFVYLKFDWTMHSVGILGLVIGLLLVGIQGGLIRYLIPKFGLQKNIIAGLFFYTAGLFLLAFAAKGWEVYVFMIPYCLGGISGPALQGFITEKVSQKQQGELQGVIASINSFSIVVGPLFLSYVFRYFTAKSSAVYFPGAPYIVAGVLMLISVWLVIKSFRRDRLRDIRVKRAATHSGTS
jgi:MFS transporter, DHA1 family, tetracycline resistance protein